MNTLEKHVKIALEEIGPIQPYPCQHTPGMYIFNHPTYPVVDYVAETPEQVVEGYKRILKEWIADRLAGKVPEFIEKKTSGRGGARTGAGRRKGSITKGSTAVVRVPAWMADWVKDPSHQEQIRRLMET